MECLNAYLDSLAHEREKKGASSILGGYVIGNTSGDFDSWISALVLAYFLTELNHRDKVFYPVLNISRSQLEVRDDLTRFLHILLNSSENDPVERYFFCSDDPVVSPLFSQEPFKNPLQISLVDHHEKTESLSYPSWVLSSIVHVVDHHSDESTSIESIHTQLSSWNGGPLQCLAPTSIGSCCSLITLLLKCSRAAQRLLKNKPPGFNVCKALALTIVKDTNGFNNATKLQRWGPLDEEAFFF